MKYPHSTSIRAHHKLKSTNRVVGCRRMNIAEHVFKMVEDYSCRLEEQLKTRMEETAVEKRKRPSHSAVVVEALNAGVAVTPETHNEVSIYISEIAGFTTTSAMSTPLQFVGLLNDLYTLFYKTIANYDIYKVGSICDSECSFLWQV
ncbi:Retinal guanylyl cyclase 1 [Taenia solium]|eukprot:TsM_000382100 transcript=TsM_000382100 gene=TsM_000382100